MTMDISKGRSLEPYFIEGKPDGILPQRFSTGRVADLKDEDKEECLMVRMECRDGDGVLWLNPIIRDGEAVTLGDARQVSLDDNLKKDRYFV